MMHCLHRHNTHFHNFSYVHMAATSMGLNKICLKKVLLNCVLKMSGNVWSLSLSISWWVNSVVERIHFLTLLAVFAIFP